MGSCCGTASAFTLNILTCSVQPGLVGSKKAFSGDLPTGPKTTVSPGIPCMSESLLSTSLQCTRGASKGLLDLGRGPSRQQGLPSSKGPEPTGADAISRCPGAVPTQKGGWGDAAPAETDPLRSKTQPLSPPPAFAGLPLTWDMPRNPGLHRLRRGLGTAPGPFPRTRKCKTGRGPLVSRFAQKPPGHQAQNAQRLPKVRPLPEASAAPLSLRASAAQTRIMLAAGRRRVLMLFRLCGGRPCGSLAVRVGSFGTELRRHLTKKLPPWRLPATAKPV